MKFFLCLISIFTVFVNHGNFFLPVDVPGDADLQLTGNGAFAVLRSARPGIAAHLHTGIDIKRPSANYKNELIYPLSRGVVISKRDDGPFAQLICAHDINGLKLWTVYEHIAGIMVRVGDSLSPAMPLARFMNREELNRFGWQFDHFHFEILKIRPVEIETDHRHPQRFYRSYTLSMYKLEELEKHFYDPVQFLDSHINP